LTKKGFTAIDVAGNGQVAVDMVTDKSNIALKETGLSDMNYYGLILMDIEMPVLNGFEASRRLIANGCQTPIIPVTAAATPEVRHTCISIGMSSRGMLTKPFETEKLLYEIALLSPFKEALNKPEKGSHGPAPTAASPPTETREMVAATP
jgi:CheY-like chemotaxis protein